MNTPKRWFAAVNPHVILDADLSPAARLVYTTLACYADKTGACFVSNTRVAVATGYSRKSVQRAISELVDAGVVTREARFVEGRQQSSITVLVDIVTPTRQVPPGGHS